MGFVGLVALGDIHVEGINASLNASGIQATGLIIRNIMNYNLFVGLNGGGVVRNFLCHFWRSSFRGSEEWLLTTRPISTRITVSSGRRQPRL